ncbi:hypothetical protein [Allokutzneria albata]|uniref:hypothetical protein n=1 Tax=Allokutzneria albata TaxID=211114 RepID=UPI0012FA7A3E|nr:hypothetical protein [Allokutzneria albata]
MTPPHDHDEVELLPASRFEWERIIRRARLTKPVKLVALLLATYADPDGTRVRPGWSCCAWTPATVTARCAASSRHWPRTAWSSWCAAVAAGAVGYRGGIPADPAEQPPGAGPAP